jgi:streptogramin lyase
MSLSKKFISLIWVFVLLLAAFPAQTNAAYEYDSQFGSSGSGNGQFNSPFGIALDASDNIYVVDSANNRVQKFNPLGVYQSQFGSSGSGNGQFSSPRGIDVDSTGNIYVVDTGNNRIQKFNSSGVYQSKFGTTGSGNGQFNIPTDIAFDSIGNIYITDAANQRIQKFNSSGVYQSKFGSNGSGDGQFSYPQAVDLDSADNIYIADTDNHRIQKFNSSGVYQSKFGSNGSGDGQFSSRAIFIDLYDNLYLGDTVNNRIQKFNSSGVYQLQFANGQVSVPYGIVINSTGGVYISNYGTNVVKKYILEPGVTLSEISLNILEGGGGETYTIVLDTQVSDDVVVTLSASDPVSGSGVSLFPSELTFTSENWNTPQEVTVTAVDDDHFDNNRSVIISSVVVSDDIDYDGLSVDDVEVNITEDEDEPGVTFSQSSLSITEGDDDTYTAVLDSEISDDVVITLSASDPVSGSGVTLSTSELTFTPENRDTPQEVTVTVVDDSVYDGSRSVDISSTITSNDLHYDGLNVDDVNINIAEDESEPGVMLSEAFFNLTEGEEGIYTIVLDSELTADDVTITLSASDPVSGSGVSLSPPELTFTSENWDTPQEVTVTAVDDETVDGNRSVLISSTVSSEDVNYDGISVDDVEVNILEDDAVSITTCAELQAMNEDLSEFYALANDIDCTGFDPEENGKGFIPVGTNGDPFIGGFFGNGYTISNLTINRPDEYYIGLFGAIDVEDGTTFSDLTITGSVEGYGYTGAFAGEIYGDVILDSINSSVEIISNDGDGYVGGLVGYSSDELNIIDSSVSADITTEYAYYGLGGLVGYASSGGSIENSYYEGTITVNSPDYGVDYGVGGLLGYNNDEMDIINSHATGAINITANYVNQGVGGLAGYYAYGGDITDSYADMDISITINDANYVTYGVGGLIGYGYDNDEINITNSHYNGDISVMADVGYVEYGIGGLIGYNDAPTNITLSSATGSIYINSGDYVEYGVGGLAGYYYYGGNIDQSYSDIDITINAVDYVAYGVGGLYGYNGDNVNITDSYSRGDISVTTESGYIESVGGIYGHNDGYDVVIDNSYATGDITLDSGDYIYYAGGFVGYNDGTDTISNSFSTGTLLYTSGTDDISYIGGFIGFADGDTLDNNYFDKISSREDFCTGDGGEVEGCTGIIDEEGDDFKGNSITPPLDTWDFEDIWRVNENDFPTFADHTAPILSEVEPVETPSTNTRPSYTFSTNEEGTIDYQGSCSSDATLATEGDNTITFDRLSPGTYSDCTLTVTDGSDNTSDPLTVSSFTIRPRIISSGGGGGGSTPKPPVIPPPTVSPPVEVPADCLPGYLFSPSTGKSCVTTNTPVNTPATPTPGGPSTPPLITKVLKLGMNDPEVKLLQIYLNTHNFPVSLIGPGSLGHETNFFGPKTKAAVILFQKAKGLVPDGIVGPKTKAVMI